MGVVGSKSMHCFISSCASFTNISQKYLTEYCRGFTSKAVLLLLSSGQSREGYVVDAKPVFISFLKKLLMDLSSVKKFFIAFCSCDTLSPRQKVKRIFQRTQTAIKNRHLLNSTLSK